MFVEEGKTIKLGRMENRPKLFQRLGQFHGSSRAESVLPDREVKYTLDEGELVLRLLDLLEVMNRHNDDGECEDDNDHNALNSAVELYGEEMLDLGKRPGEVEQQFGQGGKSEKQQDKNAAAKDPPKIASLLPTEENQVGD